MIEDFRPLSSLSAFTKFHDGWDRLGCDAKWGKIMGYEPLIGRFFYSMSQMRALYDDLLFEASENCGLTRQEADVLLFLSNNPALDTAREISRYRGFSKAFVSKAVDPLVRRGLLSTRVDALDRRCQHLILTEKAVPLARALQDAQRAFAGVLSRGIPAEKIGDFIALIEHFGGNAAAATAAEKTNPL